MGHSSQPTFNSSVRQQYGSNGSYRGAPTWNRAPAATYLNGANVNGGSLEIDNINSAVAHPSMQHPHPSLQHQHPLLPHPTSIFQPQLGLQHPHPPLQLQNLVLQHLHHQLQLQNLAFQHPHTPLQHHHAVLQHPHTPLQHHHAVLQHSHPPMQHHHAVLRHPHPPLQHRHAVFRHPTSSSSQDYLVRQPSSMTSLQSNGVGIHRSNYRVVNQTAPVNNNNPRLGTSVNRGSLETGNRNSAVPHPSLQHHTSRSSPANRETHTGMRSLESINVGINRPNHHVVNQSAPVNYNLRLRGSLETRNRNSAVPHPSLQHHTSRSSPANRETHTGMRSLESINVGINRPNHHVVNQSAPVNYNLRLRLLQQDEVAILEIPGSSEVSPSSNQHENMQHTRGELLPQTAPQRNIPIFSIIAEDGIGILEFSEVNNRLQHRNMRLGVDNMPYEEFLALEERIGNRTTGLSEENIRSCLKTRTHISTSTSLLSNESADVNEEAKTCIVCQDEYKNQDRIGTLRCGHEYHAECINEWLLLKNVCPICKRPAQTTE